MKRIILSLLILISSVFADAAVTNFTRQVKDNIAKKYDIGDEIALNKLAVDDEKRTDYETFVGSCISKGDEQKAEIGY